MLSVITTDTVLPFLGGVSPIDQARREFDKALSRDIMLARLAAPWLKQDTPMQRLVQRMRECEGSRHTALGTLVMTLQELQVMMPTGTVARP
jgi:hypothetical protein